VDTTAPVPMSSVEKLASTFAKYNLSTFQRSKDGVDIINKNDFRRIDSGHVMTGLISSLYNSLEYIPVVVKLQGAYRERNASNNRECRAPGQAKADFGTHRFAVNIHSIVCNYQDDLEFVLPVEGTVFGSDGYNGIKAHFDQKSGILSASSGRKVDAVIESPLHDHQLREILKHALSTEFELKQLQSKKGNENV
jgi:hypothetical protein